MYTPAACAERLKDRAAQSPGDLDAPLFLKIAAMLVNHDEQVVALKEGLATRDEVITGYKELVEEQKAEIEAEGQVRKQARLERDQFRTVLARCPELPEHFDLRELADFCEKLKAWQDGPCAEVLQDYGRHIEKLQSGRVPDQSDRSEDGQADSADLKAARELGVPRHEMSPADP